MLPVLNDTIRLIGIDFSSSWSNLRMKPTCINPLAHLYIPHRTCSCMSIYCQTSLIIHAQVCTQSSPYLHCILSHTELCRYIPHHWRHLKCPHALNRTRILLHPYPLTHTPTHLPIPTYSYTHAPTHLPIPTYSYTNPLISLPLSLSLSLSLSHTHTHTHLS